MHEALGNLGPDDTLDVILGVTAAKGVITAVTRQSDGNAGWQPTYGMPRLLYSKFTGRRVDAWLLGGFLVTAILLGGFLALGSEVAEGETLAFDRRVLVGLRTSADLSVPIGPRWLVPMMVDFTSLGGVAVLTLVTILAAGFLFSRRKPGLGIFLLAAVGSGALVSTLLKSLFFRARPTVVDHLVQVHSASFPSGHAMNSAVVYLTLGTLLALSMGEKRVRIYLVSVAIGLTTLVGVNRIYLGVHWPTDVVAGWGVGAAWAIVCSIGAQALQRRAAVEKGDPGNGAS